MIETPAATAAPDFPSLDQGCGDKPPSWPHTTTKSTKPELLSALKAAAARDEWWADQVKARKAENEALQAQLEASMNGNSVYKQMSDYVGQASAEVHKLRKQLYDQTEKPGFDFIVFAVKVLEADFEWYMTRSHREYAFKRWLDRVLYISPITPNDDELEAVVDQFVAAWNVAHGEDQS